MPVNLNLDHITESIGLDECYEAVIESKFDPCDVESFQAIGPLLKKLNNNQTFLSDILIAELEEHCASQSLTNRYTPQVIMLKGAQKGINFFMRANIWLPKSDPLLLASGEKSFFYRVPHDHNFNFLTSGYLGSGYHSDYYEYDYERVVGYPGEKANLRFIEHKQFGQGQIMLYRACRDVHNQLPADDLSVTLNIMPSMMFSHLHPQYVFNEQCTEVERTTVTTNGSIEPVLYLIAQRGSGKGLDFVEHLAQHSIIEEDRFRAIKALTSVQSSKEGKLNVLEKLGLKSKSKLVREMTKSHQAALGYV
ncbi:hypothetical protein J6I75_08680 [Pseudidiomarina sp. 1APP75-27a]|uniref:hypothetical protein n=1 Tax=Pseudidiomarina terrestris TaxID=2820060 RepID=UPI002B05342C|nr:hypothetical protein [Pseudidiomarina sp. 1APP75-27a]MEA3588426.1 hypothetical protein [Pseudidiomarina sp. 1APP75-27a]